MIVGGKTREVNVTVDDLGAFAVPWNAIQRYRRVREGSIIEESCAENSYNYRNYFEHDVGPIPQADKQDF